jgi:hypothetical protein
METVGENNDEDNHQGEEDRGEDSEDNGGQHQHQHSSTPNHRREQLLAGWRRGAAGTVRGP